jgi:uncharacterized protein YlxP (DUF503 family)
MSIGLLTLHLFLPGCTSLKEKRGRIQPILARLHKEFNISAAEIEQQDSWQHAVIACALVSNDHGYTQRVLNKVARFVELTWPDENVVNQKLELL